MAQENETPLRYGWTTGACAAAATKAAYKALLTGQFEKSVTITLPKGQTPSFTLVETELNETGTGERSAQAGIIKDAGDDPDVTHGAVIIARVSYGSEGQGLIFKAGPGVGTVTKPGLPLKPGEPAINPAPREMIRKAIEDVARAAAENDQPVKTDLIIEISIPGGEKIAKKTWNGRLGILGGLSILGTTGIVVPYSCSAWIHSIHRGIDVARATNRRHVGAAIGNMSEKLLMARHPLEPSDILDMGDFVGGMLKYLKKNPIDHVSIAGGFAKMSKLAEGAMDLHSKRSVVNKTMLAAALEELGANPKEVDAAKTANTALEILNRAQELQVNLGDHIAAKALQQVQDKLGTDAIELEILLCDRTGNLVGRAATNGFQPAE
ncbi:MAG: cobalt-precorrin-5B C(1)-methyltransferase [Rhodomicrobium sp.]|nr:MAG: cobalt-precorrin-5B C(1)-methyltransferase [Rhodomicrobium sp.]